MGSLFNSQDRFDMENDIQVTGLSQRTLYDIRRRIEVADSVLGGVTVTSTAIETREIELQTLRSDEMARLGGLRIEAQFRGFADEDTNLREGDTITQNSGATNYQITFVENLYQDHIEFFARRVK